MLDLFGNACSQGPAHINIYADEVQGKACPYTNDIWNYIGIIVEDLDYPLLEDIIYERFLGNFDENSKYYEMNNKIVHWSEITSVDAKNICKRWFEYILNPDRSRRTFYSYILGLNDSHLIREEFDTEDGFNSKYNRFFRSALLYALKTFFSGRNVVVENIFHEEGQQQNHLYFPWHVINKLEKNENISFNCDKITFLPKDHKDEMRSNLIQLCDVILGASTSLIHGIQRTKRSKYREELANLYADLFKRIIENPYNKNSSYEYYNRIRVGFFPRDKAVVGDIRRLTTQFYSARPLYYLEQQSGQLRFNF